jgi:decaprenylphospho-beta-D-erythro-pentofuranosid-2-ulose 2-reductase
VNDAINRPQTVLVLGGTSDIARAIVRRLASPALRNVILGCRHPDAVGHPDLGEGVAVTVVHFEATDHDGHRDFVRRVVEDHGDLDVVVQAFGDLGAGAADDPATAARLVEVNVAGAVSSGLAVAEQLRRQGHGVLVVLSSVAGIRTRASNFVYGATKAGQDAFATGLGHALHGSGARVMVVRPGFVRTKMTAGMDDAPFATDPDAVAEAVEAGLRRGRAVVWAPPALAAVFAVLRLLPGALWRKLDR